MQRRCDRRWVGTLLRRNSQFEKTPERRCRQLGFFFFNDTATPEIYTLSLHDALPIFAFALKRPESSRVDLDGVGPGNECGEYEIANVIRGCVAFLTRPLVD